MSHVIKLKKFHSIMIVKVFQKDVDENESILSTLLKFYYEEGCQKFPSNSLVFDYEADMYDLGFGLSSMNVGTEMLYLLKLKAVDPKYINDSEYTFDKIVEAFNYLETPIIEKNCFSKKIFLKCKKRYELLIKDWNSSISSIAAQSYTDVLMKESFLNQQATVILEKLKDITVDDLYNFYLKIASSTSSKLIVGDVDDSIDNSLIELKQYKTLSYRPNYVGNGTVIVPYKSKQAYLTINYDTSIPRNDIRLVDLILINYILGGSPYSKLFELVREKYGLAYSISSSLNYQIESIEIKALISKKDYQYVLEKIDYVFEHLFDNVNLDEVKRIIKNEELLSFDSMEYYYYYEINSVMIPNKLTTEQRLDRINSITIDDLKSTLGCLNRKLVHVFGGDSND